MPSVCVRSPGRSSTSADHSSKPYIFWPGSVSRVTQLYPCSSTEQQNKQNSNSTYSKQCASKSTALLDSLPPSSQSLWSSHHSQRPMLLTHHAHPGPCNVLLCQTQDCEGIPSYRAPGFVKSFSSQQTITYRGCLNLSRFSSRRCRVKIGSAIDLCLLPWL